MNQTLPTADLNTAGTTDVIPSVAIDRIIAQRNEGIALFMQAMECLATARRILLDASGDIFLYGFEDCVFRSIRSRIGIEVRSAIRIHSINRELNFFYRFLTRFFAAFHYRGIFPQ